MYIVLYLVQRRRLGPRRGGRNDGKNPFLKSKGNSCTSSYRTSTAPWGQTFIRTASEKNRAICGLFGRRGVVKKVEQESPSQEIAKSQFRSQEAICFCIKYIACFFIYPNNNNAYKSTVSNFRPVRAAPQNPIKRWREGVGCMLRVGVSFIDLSALPSESRMGTGVQRECSSNCRIVGHIWPKTVNCAWNTF